MTFTTHQSFLMFSVQDAACSTVHQDTAEASEVVAGTAQEAQSVAGSSVSPLSPWRSRSSISTGTFGLLAVIIVYVFSFLPLSLSLEV